MCLLKSQVAIIYILNYLEGSLEGSQYGLWQKVRVDWRPNESPKLPGLLLVTCFRKITSEVSHSNNYWGIIIFEPKIERIFKKILKWHCQLLSWGRLIECLGWYNKELSFGQVEMLWKNTDVCMLCANKIFSSLDCFSVIGSCSYMWICSWLLSLIVRQKC